MIAFDVPEAIERLLAEAGQDLSQAAKEAMLVELYRQNRISHRQLADALGLSRYETDGVLKRHGVTEDLLTPTELQEQLSKMPGPRGPQ